VGEAVETRLGPVEVATAGAGDPVLFVRGTPGGSDSSLVMGRFLVDAGLQVIAPSRPGYLGTPLDGRTSIDDQADLHAALLEALGHERAAVVCWSGGGPSSYRLAVPPRPGLGARRVRGGQPEM
jgi:pimeloyl-ACP methyl ester carboxylesterase